MTAEKKREEYEGIKRGDQIASLSTLRMQKDEGHLGGYIMEGAAPGTWCPHVWDFAINQLGVRSVLDVGCGLGHVASYFQQMGCRVRAVDGSESAVRDNIVKGVVDRHDFSDGPYLPADQFDLVWSSEFVEHVEEKFSGNFLTSFCSARKYVLMTYAAPGQGGHHHVNEQTEEYWAKRLSCIGFQIDRERTLILRSLCGDHPVVGKHFRNRGLLFERTNSV